MSREFIWTTRCCPFIFAWLAALQTALCERQSRAASIRSTACGTLAFGKSKNTRFIRSSRQAYPWPLLSGDRILCGQIPSRHDNRLLPMDKKMVRTVCAIRDIMLIQFAPCKITSGQVAPWHDHMQAASSVTLIVCGQFALWRWSSADSLLCDVNHLGTVWSVTLIICGQFVLLFHIYGLFASWKDPQFVTYMTRSRAVSLLRDNFELGQFSPC